MVAEKGKMLLEIVAPSRQVVRSEHVDEVIAPGSEGEFGVLPGHTPFLTTLKVGMLSYREGTAWHHLAVDWGYAEVGPNRVIILAEGADRASEIDLDEARLEKERAASCRHFKRWVPDTFRADRTRAVRKDRFITNCRVASHVQETRGNRDLPI